ncbi:lysophospholipase D GDPD3 isoform X3 [Erinaceus europaeus]|uniref:Lysophospholipase D GDPD3 isoform X3 n=1 Tax=Erinaceus europaeus TaxID=9365 RepID=A0ABM3VXE4_ERIEU|nr:lysophospholipase D GDPD3 isoform X3 [Erinaceus europaeus]
MSSLLYYALPALGSYALLSILFLRRPRLLHAPPAPAFRPRLAAHRSGSGERLENTMEALENSMAQRADLIELDCHLTRDRVVVVSHDENLSRQSGVNRDVGSLDFEVADLVRHFDRSEITIWASEKSSVMKKCKAANPEMPTSLTVSRVVWVLLLYYLGLLPFVPIPEKFLLCFLPTIINRTYFPFSCPALNKLAAVAFKWIIMRKSLIQHLEQRGVQVVFWCLNEESDFETAFSLGATGVMTDYPTALRHYLDRHRGTS